MALWVMQSGYPAAACRETMQKREVPESSYEEFATQLEMNLGLAFGEEETVQEEEPEEKEQPRSKTMTEEEWEELLEQLDVVESVLQSMLEQNERGGKREENSEKTKEQQEKEFIPEPESEEAIFPLTQESTRSSWHTEEKEEVLFFTWYTKDAIYCKKLSGKKKDGWKIRLFGREEYEKIMLFLGRFSEEHNLVFTANPEFWLAYLDNDFDEDGFIAYFEGKETNGGRNETGHGNSKFLEENIGRWAKYLNPLGSGATKNKYIRPICRTCEVECSRKRRLTE